MTTFIEEVIINLQEKGLNLSELKFILPSKRAGTFLKHQLSRSTKTTMFAPEILSIEDFVESISGLKTVSNTELLFQFYNTYTTLHTEPNPDSFEVFSKWAQILLQDFNEIDRYLIPQDKIFDYLGAIQELKHWSLETEKTDFVKNYLAFWNKLNAYYTHFTNHLLENKLGYQGLVYRQAEAHVNTYIKEHKIQHVFLGFNALNTAEESIIQHILEHTDALIYWDIDKMFYENPVHDAGLFTRQHAKKWNYFKTHPFHWVTENYKNNKTINVVGVPKNIGQAKYIGNILKTLQTPENKLESTAIVLGNEDLLLPLLNSIPEYIKKLNVTMGFPLKSIPLASLFESLFNLHKNNPKAFYYKDVISILSHQFIRLLLLDNQIDHATKLIETIQSNNIVFITSSELMELSDVFKPVLTLLFESWGNSAAKALSNSKAFILVLKNHLNKSKDEQILSLEYTYKFHELFNELDRLNTTYNYFQSISSLHQVYKELLSSETLDFQGEPLQGLQIMGMLESRVLDFKTVIISSVNEGVLPAGKSNNSFIPLDVKLENKLPTFKEKDAVYTYHFYRLLQRAEHVYILYNTEPDALAGGEKSRFITQLELEHVHTLNHAIATPTVNLVEHKLKTVSKSPLVIQRLKEIAKRGFSPSSLTSYMRNPMDFYFQKVLKIKEYDEVEETVAANTLGTVVHNTLEDFYKPLEGMQLTVEHITEMKTKIATTVLHHFKMTYNEGDISTGKNLISFEIAKRYVLNFLNAELKAINAGRVIKIIAIEADFKQVEINIPELDFPITIGGKVDRVDEYDGTTRIIDYKTGKVSQSQVEIIDWEELTTDYDKYSKPFQILCYAYMMQSLGILQYPIEAGIVSFKNLNAGFLKFTKKDKSGKGATKITAIDQQTIQLFEEQLKRLVLDIFNENIDFEEKEVSH
ncbi:PD-(D/E)XK nuclease family protein [Formosa sediminum]|uniref:PD-(D/E)XK nuclease family protein n=1 Tax=Formosa sediminum TaxID=2594004 RepID=A0A516GNZ4_9FLAO|nr:PD-(D/E)XK nuclease family protein [Formosa sediminum]QDO93246.1 PD-(D/E)XK nuclease family protein [Formosa sediminum]